MKRITLTLAALFVLLLNVNAQNPEKEKASNAQIMFLVLNTSGFTIIPVSIIALRASGGSDNPSLVFLPILLATFVSSLCGLIITSIFQVLRYISKFIQYLQSTSIKSFLISIQFI